MSHNNPSLELKSTMDTQMKKLALDVDNLSFLEALYRMSKLAMLSILALALAFIIDTINLYFIGQEAGKLELACCGLGNSIAFILSIGLTSGMSNGIETLCSQSFGAFNFDQVGMWFNRGVAINFTFLIPSVLLCIRMDWILLLFGQDQDIAEGVGVYLRWSIPHIILVGISNSFFLLFQTTQKFFVITVVSLLAVTSHIFWAYIFISKCGWGLVGAAMALNCTLAIDNGISFVYFMFSSYYKHIRMSIFNSSTFCGWKQYLDLAIPSTLMHLSRVAGFMLLSSQVAYLGTTNLAAHGILQNTFWLLWAVALGSIYATSISMGNALGLGNMDPIPQLKLVSTVFAIGSGLIFNGSLLIFQDTYLGIFTSNKEVKELAGDMLPYLAASSMLTQIIAVNEGILRAFGEQKKAGKTNFIPYLVILHPLGWVLAFACGLDLLGLWVAYAICCSIACLFYIYHVSTVDMEQIFQQVCIRVREKELLEQMEIAESQSIGLKEEIGQKVGKWGTLNRSSSLIYDD